MIFQVWEHFCKCVTSSRSLPGAGRCLSLPGSAPVILFICGMLLRYVVFILPARIAAFLEEETNKPPGLSPQESNFFTLGGPSVSLNTALLWLDLNTSCPRRFASCTKKKSCRLQEMEQLKVVSLWCQVTFSFWNATYGINLKEIVHHSP